MNTFTLRRSLFVLLLGSAMIILQTAVSSAQDPSFDHLLASTPQPDDLPPLADDIIPPVREPAVERASSAASYRVQPILFVPADVQPNPYGLHAIDRQMRNVQHWYAEQLNGRTFTLEAAIPIRGYKARTAYFEPCYPPLIWSECSWGYASWDTIFKELEDRGYKWSSDLIQGVYLQGEGIGTALGGGQRFLVAFGGDGLFPDCHEPGCGFNVSLGGLAHELGHALGLGWHPEGSDEAYYSVMSAGFYGYPHCTFINTASYPERDILSASPFINTTLEIANPGFEECLDGWNVTAGSPDCPLHRGHSGKRGLMFSGAGPHRLNQRFPVDHSLKYDISGWLRAPVIPARSQVAVQIKALDANGSILLETPLATQDEPQSDWRRFAATLLFPDGTENAVLLLKIQGNGVVAEIDDLSVVAAAPLLPAPLISKAFDGDAVLGQEPELSWSPLFGATSYDVQVASDPFFEDVLVQDSTADSSYQVSESLAYDAYAFWRVRAVNSAGAGEWSPVWSLVPRRPTDFYNDEFETPGLESAWAVKRADPAGWRIGGFPGSRLEGYLVIDMLPGDLEPNDNAKNLLLRDAPPGDFAVETFVHSAGDFQANYRQRGLLLYKNDNNYVKLAHVYRDGWTLEFEAEKNGSIVRQDSVYLVDPVRIKIERRENTYSAYYSAGSVTWQKLGESLDAAWADIQMGATAYSVLDTGGVSSAAFNWIRVTEPCPTVSVTPSPGDGGEMLVEGANCGHDGQFRPGSKVKITADPEWGYIFSHWSGDAAGSDNPLTISEASDLNIVAHFTIDRYEPNDSPETATAINYGYSVRAEIAAHDDVEYYEDVDYFVFPGFAGDDIVVDLYPDGNLAPILKLIGPDGTTLHESESWFEDIHVEQTLATSGDHYLVIAGDCHEGGGGCDGPFTLSLDIVDQYEPNDTLETATAIAYSDTIRAALEDHDDVEFYDDVDHYRFEGAEGDTVGISIEPLSDNLEPACKLLDEAGAVLIKNDEYEGKCTIEHLLPDSGSFFVEVYAGCGEGGSGCQGPYSLTLAGQAEQKPLIYLPITVRP